jgi:hypothetical protein
MDLRSYLEAKENLSDLPNLKDVSLFNEEINDWKLYELKTKNENLFNLIKTLVNNPSLEQIDESKVFTIKMDKSGAFSITQAKTKILLEDIKLDEK